MLMLRRFPVDYQASVCRVLRLTLLSPKIAEAVLSGRLPDTVDLAKLLKPFPLEWEQQEALFLRREAAPSCGKGVSQP